MHCRTNDIETRYVDASSAESDPRVRYPHLQDETLCICSAVKYLERHDQSLILMCSCLYLHVVGKTRMLLKLATGS